ncbi:MAG: FtsW/RodA/SpoVE family cell cycle protein [Fimbriimonadaceae bacterium]
MLKRLDIPDLWVFGLAAAASVIGIFFIFDAGYAQSMAAGRGWLTREVLMQSAAMSVGLGIALWASRRKPEFWSRTSKIWWTLSLLALIAVLTPGLGHAENGANRWIKVGPITVQPAEFAKLAIVLYLAGVLAVRKPWPKFRRQPDFGTWLVEVALRKAFRLLPAVWAVLAFVLVAIEPDLGTAAVLALVAWVLFAFGGATRKSMVVGSIAALAVGWIFVTMEPYRIERIHNHMIRWEAHNVDDIGFQTVQSELAMASGGWVGVGPAAGRAKHVMPAATTDFLSTTVAEEFGFVGWLACCLGVLGGLSLRLIWLATQAKDRFSGLVLLGVGTWIGCQTATNLLMANGTLPAIGIPLPFLSYGGSSLVALWLAIGVCLALIRPRPAPEERSKAVVYGVENRGDGWRDRGARVPGSRSREPRPVGR